MELFDLVSGAAFAVPAGPICRLRVCLPPISQPTVAPRLSIVVLPFANLSYDPEQQYFADGITDDLTTDLSQIGNMFVISRNTAFERLRRGRRAVRSRRNL